MKPTQILLIAACAHTPPEFIWNYTFYVKSKSKKKHSMCGVLNIYINILSLMGRLAYVLICVEAYLIHVFLERDWRLLAKAFGLFPSMCISDWMSLYGVLTPDIVLNEYNYTQYIEEFFTLDEYLAIKESLNNRHHDLNLVHEVFDWCGFCDFKSVDHGFVQTFLI